jgi:hypothetical protein
MYDFYLISVIIIGGINSIFANFDLSPVILDGIHGQSLEKNSFSVDFSSLNGSEEKCENENENGKGAGQGMSERKEGNSMKGKNNRKQYGK